MKIDFFSEALIKIFLYAGLTLLIAVFVDYVLRSLIRVPKHFNNKRTRTAAAVTRNIITTFVYVCAGYIIITLFGIDLTPLLASASVIGIILGIGARSIIEDFVNGLFLLSQHSIAIGDYVKVSSTEGIIEVIGARTLTVRASDGTVHIIPNSQIQEVVNFSRHKYNLFIELPVKANQDSGKVIQAAENALQQLQKDSEYAEAIFPGSQVNGIESFSTPGIMTIRITLTTYPVRRWEIGRKYRLLVKNEFEKQKLVFA